MNDRILPKTPIDICTAYSQGNLSRSELIEALVNFPYAEDGRTDGYDSLFVRPSGTWSEISLAIELGYIDEKIYEEVFKLKHPDWKE